ncbi:acyl-CoA dehydrogenase family protein [Amycolatopsis sp. FDAARGOS 1241]|uniref:acyl-CoA dehydrogenase family protein n=1 Tax=Amycolatopsis sp. FDAARGOS 1241 TaxID=2778070 RepID=UPI001950CC79|nr:hypothetical protein I6J71_25515 [Amycolatopsis sp. FDAARGOS 1241]
MRALTRRTCQALDANAPEGPELALHTKVFASETAVSTINRFLRVVDVDSYSYDVPWQDFFRTRRLTRCSTGAAMAARRRTTPLAIESTPDRSCGCAMPVEPITPRHPNRPAIRHVPTRGRADGPA